MTEPTAPSPEALPGTYTKKKDAIIALRALAKHTGHKLVVPNHGSTNITLRCKGFSTTGCTFKVCVYVPIDQQGTEQATWMLDHGKQIWKHTCNPATSAASSSVATSRCTLTPSMNFRGAAGAGMGMPQPQAGQAQGEAARNTSLTTARSERRHWMAPSKDFCMIWQRVTASSASTHY
jgi:hypothetical protein